MSAHQIIYTSCRRGINGVYDGMQVYSFDAAFQDVENAEIRRMFTYRHPELENGIAMSEALARTMPVSFTYRPLENGSCAMALNTYLGRDYMGSSGRFGNYLSHVITFEPEDVCNYPAEFYGSGIWRTRMEFEEVNHPDKPEYLPAPALERGFAVTMNAVAAFLGAEGRMEVYRKMLHASLAFENTQKRVLICDKPEHIILWIASLTYALPLKNALKLSFSTYAFDPSIPFTRICGVVSEGTEYKSDSCHADFVFDMLNMDVPELEADPEFSDFIDAAMSFSTASLQAFHSFLCNGYKYREADEQIYSAYALYSILTGGIGKNGLDRLDQALLFAEKYALSEETLRIIRRLLSGNQILLREDKAIFSKVTEYLTGHIAEIGCQACCGIVREIYAQSSQNGFLIVTKLLDTCAFDGACLADMGLCLEEVLTELPAGGQETEAMWKYFGQLMSASQSDQFDAAYSAFAGRQRYDRVFMLYTLELSCVSELVQCTAIYEKHYLTFAGKEQVYAVQYFEKMLEAYYRRLARFDGSSAYERKAELFSLIAAKELDVCFADELARELISAVPLVRPSTTNAKLIRNIFQYTCSIRKQPVKGRLLILYIGMALEDCIENGQLKDTLARLQSLTQSTRADLALEDEKNILIYFRWLLSDICVLCNKTADMEAVYDLFEMPETAEAEFFSRCAELYLKRCSGIGDYGLFCEFLGMVFDKAAISSCDAVGKALSGLGKHKKNTLDTAVNDYFHSENHRLRIWCDIRDSAGSGILGLNHFTGFFKRRKG